MDFSNINYLAVLVATVTSFAIGSLWYSPVMFGKAWQKAVNLSDDEVENVNMLRTFGVSFILMFIIALGIAIFQQGHDNAESTLLGGLAHGLFIAIFFVATSYGVNLLYQQKSFKLWLIDACYQILLLAVMGMIIGAW